MKPFLLIAVLFVFGCKQSSQHPPTNNHPDIAKSQSKIKTPKALTKKHADYRKSEIDDSLELNVMMHDILVYGYKHRHASSYHKTLNNWNYEPAVTSATMTFGHLFDKARKHLIVTRSMAGSIVYIDVFLLAKNKFQPVCSSILGEITFVDDTIKDVNGDGQKDFLIHSYPSSGCCRRDVYNVFLYQKEQGNFTPGYRFINPTFSPSEKTIRGVGYGQPGLVELYKYRWNGLRVDTIEIIFPDTLRKKFHIVKHWNDFDNMNVGKFLTYAPKEYHKIESYDWFNQDY